MTELFLTPGVGLGRVHPRKRKGETKVREPGGGSCGGERKEFNIRFLLDERPEEEEWYTPEEAKKRSLSSVG